MILAWVQPHVNAVNFTRDIIIIIIIVVGGVDLTIVKDAGERFHNYFEIHYNIGNITRYRYQTWEKLDVYR